MPTVTATVHQLLRYFFVGAIAIALVLAPPGTGWRGRVAEAVRQLGESGSGPVAVVMAMVVGVLIYGVHRVLFYEALFRGGLLCVFRRTWSQHGWWWWLFPYGNAPKIELEYEVLGLSLPEARRERFVGWASEIHLLYATTEVALFTLLVWPGWDVDYCWRPVRFDGWWPTSWRVDCSPFWIVAGLVIFGCFVWAWDRHQVVVTRALANSGGQDQSRAAST